MASSFQVRVYAFIKEHGRPIGNAAISEALGLPLSLVSRAADNLAYKRKCLRNVNSGLAGTLSAWMVDQDIPAPTDRRGLHQRPVGQHRVAAPSARRIVYDFIAAIPFARTLEIALNTGLSMEAVSCATYDMSHQPQIIRNVSPKHMRAQWEIIPGGSPPSGRTPGQSVRAQQRRAQMPKAEVEEAPAPTEFEYCELAALWTLYDPALRPPAHAERV